MSLVQFICLALGLSNGVFLAVMPKMTDPKPSLFRLFGFGTVLAAALLFLAMAAIQDNFLRTAVLTVGLGLVGFLLTNQLCAASTKLQQTDKQAANQQLTIRPEQQKQQQQTAA